MGIEARVNRILFILVLGISLTSQAATPSIIGQWRTIDDETGKPSSIVDIFKVGSEYRGKVIQLINPDEPNPTCHNCPGDKNGKPVVGLEILWGMKETKPNDEWADGRILDPRKGKTYKCRMRLMPGGNTLSVRGFIGFSLLGRSQNWYRAQ